MRGPDIRVDLPPWAVGRERVGDCFPTDESRMRFAISLARANVEEGTGGPFGAALFERDSGRLVSIGVNSVVRLSNSALHAEMVAFMRAQARLGSYTLAASGLPESELHSSCDPCAMCLGAVLWSGVSRLVCAASRDDAVAMTFEEGPVFPASYEYLEQRGIVVERGFLRDEAAAVLDLYRRQGGVIYNR
jgi:tRNA(Arg) A34 adenosine deaminase TadA